MNNKNIIWPLLIGAIVGCFYFFLSYNSLVIMGVSVYLIFGVGSFVGTFVLIQLLSAKTIKTALLLAFGAELSIVASIFLDISNDSSTHNLFPIEVCLTFAVLFSAALAGGFIAKQIGRTKK